MEDDTHDSVNFLFENVNIAYQKLISNYLVSSQTCTPPKLYSTGRKKLASDILASSISTCNASNSLRLWVFQGLVAFPSDSVAHVEPYESASFCFGLDDTWY